MMIFSINRMPRKGHFAIDDRLVASLKPPIYRKTITNKVKAGSLGASHIINGMIYGAQLNKRSVGRIMLYYTMLKNGLTTHDNN